MSHNITWNNPWLALFELTNHNTRMCNIILEAALWLVTNHWSRLYGPRISNTGAKSDQGSKFSVRTASGTISKPWVWPLTAIWNVETTKLTEKRSCQEVNCRRTAKTGISICNWNNLEMVKIGARIGDSLVGLLMSFGTNARSKC